MSDLNDSVSKWDLGHSLLSGRCNGFSYRADTAGGEEVASCRIGVSRGAKQQYQASSRRPPPERGPKDAACSNRGPKQVSLKEFRDQVRDRHGRPAQQVVSVGFAQAAHLAA